MREEILARLELQNAEAEGKIMAEQGKEEKILWDTKLTVRDAAIKSWAMNLMEEQHQEWKKMFEQKMADQVEKFQLEAVKAPKMALQKSPAVPDSLEIRSLKEEVMQHFEDDRRLRNIRFNEIYNLIEQNKAMQTELITQQFDSQKALMKAIVNKETAERMLADEEL